MTVSRTRLDKALLAMLLVGGLFVLFPGMATAEDPVSVTVEVTGDAVPGATVTATATVTINDNSALQSIAWSQIGGVPATLQDVMTDTLTATLGDRAAYREQLIHTLSEPPVTAAQLPPNVPVPDEEFVGGLQNRFGVVAINPFSEEEAAATTFEVEVVTTSGTYTAKVAVHATLPWAWSTGLRTVPMKVPVLLHGKEQASYDWVLKRPTGSSSTLAGATTQSPEFTPDISGTYQVTVTDLSNDETISVSVSVGAWHGVIVGQDSMGRPVSDPNCTGCHNGSYAPDVFAEWKQTGHAEIFTDNLNTSTHYGESCLACHTVGYNPGAFNHGFDDAPDYQAFLDSGMLHHADLTNWTTMLNVYPATAKLGNIQCENCHGPQNTASHMLGNGSRVTLSSDVCGSCHGEPARHGRFQQWQLSGHANYELAVDESQSGSCARCHTGNGFLAWEDLGFDADEDVTITWTEDETHPQTCQTCHDPHAIGTTSGSDATNATVRISGDTPMLVAGFVATDVGRGAICMTCHNSRRGLRNDSTFKLSDASRATHPGPQADVLMGQNAYFVQTGNRSYHSKIEDSCVTCHMEATPPPADLSYNLGGTNHTFYASNTICADCHSVITAADVQGPVETKMEELKAALEEALSASMEAHIANGASIDLDGDATITDATTILGIEFTESRGRQAIEVTLTSGVVGPTSLADVDVVFPGGAAKDLLSVSDPNLGKAGWNYFLAHSDGSHGVHNPGFINAALDVALFAAENVVLPGSDAGSTVGGGPGEGRGAVACTTPYVYWADIVARTAGAVGSAWRTDIVARNLGSSDATLQFVLHGDSGNVTGPGSISAAGQGIFADIVSMLGANGKGSLEICSDQPLLVAGRTFNQTETGTYGQYLDGHVADLGLSAGQSGQLLGLRQETNLYRTNIVVTNGGTSAAEVAVTLYDNDGTSLKSYTLSIGAGKAVQDLEPFKNRAGKADLGWGFAEVTVLSGSNILTSAAVVDMVTSDPTTVLMKR